MFARRGFCLLFKFLLQTLPFLFRFFQQFLQLGFAFERIIACPGANPHAVLSKYVQARQAFGTQGRNVGDHLLLEPFGVLSAEIGERVVIHVHPAAEPLIGIAVITPPVQFASFANPLVGGV